MNIKNKYQLFAVMWMIIACLSFSILSVLSVKLEHIPSPQFFFLTVIICLFIMFFINFIRNKQDLAIPKQYNLYIYRAFFASIGMNLWFFVAKNIPITEATAISYTTPLFISLLAIILLKEQILFYRVCSLIIGFLGCVIIIRPTIDKSLIYPLLGIVSAFFWACSDIILKIQTNTENIFKQSFYLTLFMSIFSFFPAIYQYSDLSFNDWIYIIIIAILYLFSLFSIYYAYKYGQLTVVAPLDFLRLIITSAIAYIFYGEIVDLWVYIGSFIIILSSLILIKKSI